MSWKSLPKKDLRSILIEIPSVVFAVLLALFLNEWRNSINQDKLLENARSNLQEELLFNQKELREKISSHQAQLHNLTEFKDSVDVLDQPFSTYNLGVAVLNLKVAAWNSITLTDVVNQMEFSELGDFSELYQAFQLINKLQDSYIAEAFSLNFNNAENSNDAYYVTKSHLEQMIRWEQELLSEIDDRLNK